MAKKMKKLKKRQWMDQKRRKLMIIKRNYETDILIIPKPKMIFFLNRFIKIEMKTNKN